MGSNPQKHMWLSSFNSFFFQLLKKPWHSSIDSSSLAFHPKYLNISKKIIIINSTYFIKLHEKKTRQQQNKWVLAHVLLFTHTIKYIPFWLIVCCRFPLRSMFCYSRAIRESVLLNNPPSNPSNPHQHYPTIP